MMDSDLNKKVLLLEKALIREKKIRFLAEKLLEDKSRDLFYSQEKQQKQYDELKLANLDISAKNDELAQNHTQLLHADKMASLGQLSAGIAHEINNPIGYVLSNLNVLADYLVILKEFLNKQELLIEALQNKNINHAYVQLELIQDFKQDNNFDFILEDMESIIPESIVGTKSIREISLSLKKFSRKGVDKSDLVNVNDCLRNTLKMVKNKLKYKCLVVENFEELPKIKAYEGQLNQVFINILINAADAIPKRGEITLRTRVKDEIVIIDIEDNGDGIDQANLNKLFDPFFTTKPLGKGTGLGLSISYGIVKQHFGKIVVQSRLGIGTKFSIYLPIDSKNSCLSDIKS